MMKFTLTSFFILSLFIVNRLNAQITRGPIIRFNNLNYDFGTIGQNEEAKCTFKFINEGDQPLIITSAKGSCSCTVPNWPREIIQPGKTGEISIIYDTKKVGKFSKSVRISSNDSINPLTILKITGEVIELIENDSNVSLNNTPIDTIKIGNQTWTASNLNVQTFRNGDTIPEAKTDEEWKKAGEEGRPVWCYYNNDSSNAPKYGRLYNFYAVSDTRGLAPIGFHIPTNDEWNKLETYLGGDSVAGEKLRNNEGWQTGNGSNLSGFCGIPGGSRNAKSEFIDIQASGYWWSTTNHEQRQNFAYMRRLNDANRNFYTDDTPKIRGCSVRCIKN
jgi:uncharacterized protein (TIGR02145 family)